MFNREDYRTGLQMFMTDADMIEKALDKMEYRHRNLKKGDNVIHLSYSGSVISEEDILKFEKELNAVEYKLSYIDGDGEISADFFEITNQIIIGVGSFAVGILTNTVSNIVTPFFVRMWEHGTTKLTNKLQSGKVTRHQPTSAITIYHGKHKSIVYFFPNDLPSKTVGKAVEKLLEKTVKHHKKYEHKDAYYEHYELQRNGLWKHFKLEQSKKKRKRSKKLVKQVLQDIQNHKKK